ncbi:unnamed protein product [Angiostrongylus costaricensis]|uniref:CPG4 domain-containing protein n=1 Tax=Angiostrongylus costaricensis TaxID=334426 RepID=A0A0R3PMS2_ANGCS|nr:unnamed protein product [Angiostrongylus costaricensis]
MAATVCGGDWPSRSLDSRKPYCPKGAHPDSCVGQCAFTFVEKIRNQLGNAKTASLLQLNYNDFLVAFSNTTFFENSCKIYHNFQHCSSKCEPGYLHQLLMKSSEIIDHYCVYHYEAIRAKFPCLENVISNTDCIKSCTRHHDAVTSLINNFRHLALNGDSTRAEQYLAQSCEYVTCTLHCDVPAIASRCDFVTANLVIDLTRRSFASMEKMALDMNVISRWPAVCSDIKTYRLPAPANPPKEIGVVAQSHELLAGEINNVVYYSKLQLFRRYFASTFSYLPLILHR